MNGLDIFKDYILDHINADLAKYLFVGICDDLGIEDLEN